MSNPGFSHIAQNIIWRLDHKSQLNCRMVDQTWKAQVDQPYFWIKKLDCEKGQSKDLSEAWIDLAGKIEKGSYLEQELRKCLMRFFLNYSITKKSALNRMMPIHVAARNEESVEILKFIASFTDDCNPPKSDGWTPLHLAAHFGHIENVKFLATKIGNPNPPLPSDWTPMHLAARMGHTEIVEFLTSKIENPNPPKPDGWTPIHLATIGGHTDIVKVLVPKVKNPNSSLPNGKTAAKIAAERNHQDILNIFEINQALNDSFWHRFICMILEGF